MASSQENRTADDRAGREAPRHLDPRIKWVWFLPTLVALVAIWLVVNLAVLVAQPDQVVFGLHGWGFTGVFSVFLFGLVGGIVYMYNHLEYISFTYEMGGKEIVIRRGVFTRETTVIPYARIQNINTERSVIERLIGLASLYIDTAGTNIKGSEAHLPGVSHKDELIRELMDHAEKAKLELEREENGLGPLEKDLRSEKALLADILKELVDLNHSIQQSMKGGAGRQFPPLPHNEKRL
ncbi:MAG: PH domain-containing protein [Candidatus Micrarchaeota archaeon]